MHAHNWSQNLNLDEKHRIKNPILPSAECPQLLLKLLTKIMPVLTRKKVTTLYIQFEISVSVYAWIRLRGHSLYYIIQFIAENVFRIHILIYPGWFLCLTEYSLESSLKCPFSSILRWEIILTTVFWICSSFILQMSPVYNNTFDEILFSIPMYDPLPSNKTQ